MHFGYFNNITVYSSPCFFFSIDPQMELLNDISLCLISWVTAMFLFLAAVHFTFLPSTCKDSSFSASFQLSLLLFSQASSPWVWSGAHSNAELCFLSNDEAEWLFMCLWAWNKCKDSWSHLPRMEPFLSSLLSLCVWLYLCTVWV